MSHSFMSLMYRRLACRSSAHFHNFHGHLWSRMGRNTITHYNDNSSKRFNRLYLSDSNDVFMGDTGDSEDLDRDLMIPTWKKLSDKINIPYSQLDISYTRSSDKNETEAIFKLHLGSADWIPVEVRKRIWLNEQERINMKGYLVLSSRKHTSRTQARRQVVNELKYILCNYYYKYTL